MRSVLLTLSVLAACAEPYTEQVGESGEPKIKYQQVTETSTSELDPSWSPDGKWLAYTAHDDGIRDIWIRRLDGSDSLQVTSHRAIDELARWSPAGDRLVFVSERNGVKNIYTVDPFVGESSVKPVTTDADKVTQKLISWSPDGSRIAYASDLGGSWNIWTIDAEGGNAFQVTSRDLWEWDPDWSPDGKWIAFNAVPPGQFLAADLWVVAADGGELRQLTDDPNVGDWIAFTSIRASRVRQSVWMMPSSGGDLVLVTEGENSSQRPDWSPDGRHITYYAVKGTHAVSPRQFQIVSLESADDVTNIPISAQGLTGDWSPDGRQIAIIKAGADAGIWIVPAGSGEPRQLVAIEEGSLPWYHTVSWSPDGRMVAYANRADDMLNHIWTVPVAGGTPNQITVSPREDANLSWSPDSRQIAFSSHRAHGDGWDVWTIPADGGLASPVVEKPGVDALPRWSPDGSRLAFTSDRKPDAATEATIDSTYRWGIWTVPAEGGEPTWIAAGAAANWSADGDEIFYLNREALWKIPATGGSPGKVRDLGDVEGIRLSPDGRRLLAATTRSGDEWDLWIADVTALVD